MAYCFLILAVSDIAGKYLDNNNSKMYDNPAWDGPTCLMEGSNVRTFE